MLIRRIVAAILAIGAFIWIRSGTAVSQPVSDYLIVTPPGSGVVVGYFYMADPRRPYIHAWRDQDGSHVRVALSYAARTTLQPVEIYSADGAAASVEVTKYTATIKATLPNFGYVEVFMYDYNNVLGFFTASGFVGVMEYALVSPTGGLHTNGLNGSGFVSSEGSIAGKPLGACEFCQFGLDASGASFIYPNDVG